MCDMHRTPPIVCGHAALLYYPMFTGHEELARTLLILKVSMSAPSSHQHTHQRILIRPSAGVPDAFNDRVNLDAPCDSCSGWSLMEIAVARGYHNIAHILLDCGADIAGTGGESVYEAATNGRFNMVHLLLRYRANADVAHGAKASLSSLAAFAGNLYTVRLLLASGVDPNRQCRYPGTALIAAIRGEQKAEQVRIIELLILYGADVNLKAEFCEF